MKGALITGTVLSMAVTGAWSLMAEATMGPAPALHLSVHHLFASYLALAAAPTGNGPELFAVVAVIYTLCLLPTVRRHLLRRQATARRPGQPPIEPETARYDETVPR